MSAKFLILFFRLRRTNIFRVLWEPFFNRTFYLFTRHKICNYVTVYLLFIVVLLPSSYMLLFTTLRTWQPRNHEWIPVRDKIYFSGFSKIPDGLYSAPSPVR